MQTAEVMRKFLRGITHLAASALLTVGLIAGADKPRFFPDDPVSSEPVPADAA